MDELSKASYTVTISSGRSTVVQRLEMPKRGRPRAPGRGAPSPQLSTGDEEQGGVPQLTTASLPPPPAAVASNVPRFEVPLDIRSIPDLWLLWRYGRAGMPSIESLEANYGAAWRPKSQKSVFCGRKAIVDVRVQYGAAAL
ncbi:hypothetical protein N657DRAFT_651095 [Parathielavia appendiculata]|uniref:Transcription activator GCR1-like domain-containing protein n=1 Tax=Parathielavia appendiculata TaxID=2587402 RepID=A0AAN6YY99_9PEZI|nr:hypothetical protein N657DRAFT_651095 [Parathielavia appendiculata]